VGADVKTPLGSAGLGMKVGGGKDLVTGQNVGGKSTEAGVNLQGKKLAVGASMQGGLKFLFTSDPTISLPKLAIRLAKKLTKSYNL
jgi:hypothetical protein